MDNKEQQAQDGMLEEFIKLLPEAKAHLDEVSTMMNEDFTEDMQEDPEIIAAATALIMARKFCVVALADDHPPYDLDGVQFMLKCGQKLEASALTFPTERTRDGVSEAVVAWREAIINFPMSRRYGPAVAWHAESVLPLG